MVEGGDRERDLEAGNVWRMTRGRSSATRRRVCGRKGPGGRRQAIVELGCLFALSGWPPVSWRWLRSFAPAVFLSSALLV